MFPKVQVIYAQMENILIIHNPKYQLCFKDFHAILLEYLLQHRFYIDRMLSIHTARCCVETG